MPDFNDIVRASSVMWVKKYFDDVDRNWKCMFEYFCKKANLGIFLQSDFDVDELPPDLPLYYKNSLLNWQHICNHMSSNNLSNWLWYNKHIKLGNRSIYNKNLMSIGMWTINDLYENDKQTIIPFKTWQNRGATELDRLTWLGIINVVKPNRHKYSKSNLVSAGIYVNDQFISIQKVTQ